MYEHKSEPLLPFGRFARRLLGHFIIALVAISGSLGIGVAGYHFLGKLPWLDSLLNASMILGGMGPVDAIRTPAGKLFASFYALFSGVVFLVIVGVLMVPIGHRFLHSLHLEKARSGGKR
ncbi:MAG TPA: hypothetical protein VHP61_08220 [Acidobacteriota bacterium]|nr:hypothetical protein [Acidobacteriota bacterium]